MQLLGPLLHPLLVQLLGPLLGGMPRTLLPRVQEPGQLRIGEHPGLTGGSRGGEMDDLISLLDLGAHGGDYGPGRWAHLDALDGPIGTLEILDGGLHVRSFDSSPRGSQGGDRKTEGEGGHPIPPPGCFRSAHLGDGPPGLFDPHLLRHLLRGVPCSDMTNERIGLVVAHDLQAGDLLECLLEG